MSNDMRMGLQTIVDGKENQQINVNKLNYHPTPLE
jgi:hypothetical protein